MASDEQLVARVRASLVQERQIVEKAMFGRRMFADGPLDAWVAQGVAFARNCVKD